MNDVGYHFEALYALEIDFCNEGEEVYRKKEIKAFWAKFYERFRNIYQIKFLYRNS